MLFRAGRAAGGPRWRGKPAFSARGGPEQQRCDHFRFVRGAAKFGVRSGMPTRQRASALPRGRGRAGAEGGVRGAEPGGACRVEASCPRLCSRRPSTSSTWTCPEPRGCSKGEESGRNGRPDPPGGAAENGDRGLAGRGNPARGGQSSPQDWPSPNGVHVVAAGRGGRIHVPVSALRDLPGIGPAFLAPTEGEGAAYRQRTRPRSKSEWLARWFGPGRGAWLWERVRGIDPTEVDARESAQVDQLRANLLRGYRTIDDELESRGSWN